MHGWRESLIRQKVDLKERERQGLLLQVIAVDFPPVGHHLNYTCITCIIVQ